jgi:hypothetical protein
MEQTHQKEGDMMMGQVWGGCGHKPRNADSYQEVVSDKERFSPKTSRGGATLLKLIFDFWTPDLGESCFKPLPNS